MKASRIHTSPRGRSWTVRSTLLAAAIVGFVATSAGAEPPLTAPPTPPATTPSTQPIPPIVIRPDSTPDYSTFTQSVHIPYIPWGAKKTPVDFDHLATIHVRVSINGGPPMALQADTGSVGVIVSADAVPNIDPNAPEGNILYTSSGNELIGVWTPATITFLDSKDDDGNPVTATVPVLAAKEYRYHPGTVNAKKATTAPAPVTKPYGPGNYPKVYMMGMGFGRGKEPHQERNPFVNIKQMRDGQMRRGYTFTRDGITLGLAKDKVGDGYIYQPLTERDPSDDMKKLAPGLKDWESSPGWVTVDGKSPGLAKVLIDTGLTNMMIGDPNLSEDNVPIENGAQVTVALLNGKAHYSFKVGDKEDPTAPSKANWVKPSVLFPTLNTGLRTLAIYDYLYDADGGYLGLRPTREHP